MPEAIFPGPGVLTLCCHPIKEKSLFLFPFETWPVFVTATNEYGTMDLACPSLFSSPLNLAGPVWLPQRIKCSGSDVSEIQPWEVMQLPHSSLFFRMLALRIQPLCCEEESRARGEATCQCSGRWSQLRSQSRAALNDNHGIGHICRWFQMPALGPLQPRLNRAESSCHPWALPKQHIGNKINCLF